MGDFSEVASVVPGGFERSDEEVDSRGPSSCFGGWAVSAGRDDVSSRSPPSV